MCVSDRYKAIKPTVFLPVRSQQHFSVSRSGEKMADRHWRIIILTCRSAPFSRRHLKASLSPPLSHSFYFSSLFLSAVCLKVLTSSVWCALRRAEQQEGRHSQSVSAACILSLLYPWKVRHFLEFTVFKLLKQGNRPKGFVSSKMWVLTDWWHQKHNHCIILQ